MLSIFGWQKACRADWEFSSIALPQASLLDSGELACAEKYAAQADDASGKEAYQEMVSAASQMEQGRFEDGASCAARALASFQEQGDAMGTTDSLRLMVLAHRAKGKLKEAHDLVFRQMEAFSTASNTFGKARMLLLLAHINHDKRGSRNRERAKEWASTARQLFTELGHPRLEAQCLLALVNIVIKQRSPFAADETKQLVDMAVPLLRAEHDVLGEAVAMHGLACARALTGIYDGAADAGREALQLFRKAKRRRLEAFELHCLAAWMLAMEDSQGAIQAAEESIHIYMQEPGMSSAQAAVLQILTKAYIVGEDCERAIAAARAALERFDGDSRAQAVALEMLALGYLQCGDFSQAAKLAEQEAALLLTLGDKSGSARALRLRCRLCVQLQDFSAAIQAASEAAATSATLHAFSEQAMALQLMADCQMRNGALVESRDTAMQARQLYRDLLDRDQEVLAMLQASQASALLDDRANALEVASEAKELANRAGRRQAEGISWHTLASLHLDWGRLADAAKMAKKALSCAKRCRNHKEQGRSYLLFVIISLMISKEFEDGASDSAETGEPSQGAATEHLRNAEEKAEELRQLAENGGALEPLCAACSCHALAVVHLHKGIIEDSLRTAQAAITAYEESSDLVGVLQMYLLMAKAYLSRRSYHEAREATESAAWLGQQLGFRSIEENANSILQEIEAAADGTSEPLRRRIPEMPNVPKMDVQALDVDVLRGVVQQFVKVLIGHHDDGIDPDRPLMEMGLTSHLAVVLRDQLAKVLPGLSPPLPVTLIYDYPSIAAITELVATTGTVPSGSSSEARLSSEH